MRTFFAVTFATMAILGISTGCRPSQTTQASAPDANPPQTAIPIPVSPTNATPAQAAIPIPVISASQYGAMSRITPKKPSILRDRVFIPGVEIFADGRCYVKTQAGDEFDRRITPDEVESLLHYFQEQGLFSLSDPKISEIIEKYVSTPTIVDLPGGGQTVTYPGRHFFHDGIRDSISVRTEALSFAVRGRPLLYELEAYPSIAELRTLHECIKRVYDAAGVGESYR